MAGVAARGLVRALDVVVGGRKSELVPTNQAKLTLSIVNGAIIYT